MIFFFQELFVHPASEPQFVSLCDEEKKTLCLNNDKPLKSSPNFWTIQSRSLSHQTVFFECEYPLIDITDGHN